MSEKSSILKAFGLADSAKVATFGEGLINSTFLVECEQKYILQKINTGVFENPAIIANNLKLCNDFLKKNKSSLTFIAPLPTIDKQTYYVENEEYWRLSPFIANSYTKNKCENPNDAYQAAKAVGEFSAALDGIALDDFEESIGNFHNLSERYKKFDNSLKIGNLKRIENCSEIINIFIGNKHLTTTYEGIKTNALFPKRVQHHDTKINNVLFDQQTHNSICLCDLDTVMPGYFISDLGDMMRTYLCSETEECVDFNKIEVRTPYFVALITGYLSVMKHKLTEVEKKYIYYAGEFLIYMQGLRFLTDYLLDDIYYTTHYENQNLNRALNQLKLLQEYQAKRGLFEQIIQNELKA